MPIPHHLVPRFERERMVLPTVGPCTVTEAPNPEDGVQVSVDDGKRRWHFVLDARSTRQLAEQLLFVIDGSVIVAVDRRVEGF